MIESIVPESRIARIITDGANFTGAVTAGADKLSGVVDCQNFQDNCIIFMVAAAAGTFNATVEESDTPGGTYTPVPNSNTGTIAAADVANQMVVIECRVQKRYQRLRYTIGTGGLTAHAALSILTNGRRSPVVQGLADNTGHAIQPVKVN